MDGWDDGKTTTTTTKNEKNNTPTLCRRRRRRRCCFWIIFLKLQFLPFAGKQTTQAPRLSRDIGIRSCKTKPTLNHQPSTINNTQTQTHTRSLNTIRARRIIGLLWLLHIPLCRTQTHICRKLSTYQHTKRGNDLPIFRTGLFVINKSSCWFQFDSINKNRRLII